MTATPRKGQSFRWDTAISTHWRMSPTGFKDCDVSSMESQSRLYVRGQVSLFTLEQRGLSLWRTLAASRPDRVLADREV